MEKKEFQKSDLAIGVDIGGTNTVVGFVNNNKCIYEYFFPTQPEKGSKYFVVNLIKTIKKNIKKFEKSYNLVGIGLAAPSVSLQGIIEDSANLKWGKFDIVNEINNFIEVPVKIINDANAAALGEYYYGLGKKIDNFVVITLGTGLGGGIILDGKLINGSNGLAGEIGHTSIGSQGRKCSCGKTDCLETYVSANGLRRTVFYLLSKYNDDSPLRKISYDKMSSELITYYAERGDIIATTAFDFTGEILGKGLANVTACFDPKAIILFGGLTNVGNLLLQPTRYYYESNLLSIYKGKTKILLSKLQNGKAAVLGAASLILKNQL